MATGDEGARVVGKGPQPLAVGFNFDQHGDLSMELLLALQVIHLMMKIVYVGVLIYTTLQ